MAHLDAHESERQDKRNSLKALFQKATWIRLWMHRIRPTLRQRWVRVLMMVLVITALLMIVRRHIVADQNRPESEFWFYLLEHLVPDGITAVVVYLLLDKGVTLLTGIAKVTNRPANAIIAAIRNKKTTNYEVVVLDTFISTYLDHGRPDPQFLNAIKSALSRGVKVRFMLLHPESDAARQRNLDLAGKENRLNLQWIMRSDLADIYKFKESLEGQVYRNFEVLLFNATPPFAFISWDSTAYVSFYRHDVSDVKSNLRIQLESKLGAFVQETIKEIGSSANIISLRQYMTMVHVSTHTRFYFCGGDEEGNEPQWIMWKSWSDEAMKAFRSTMGTNEIHLFRREGRTEGYVVEEILESNHAPDQYLEAATHACNRYNWEWETSLGKRRPPIFRIRSIARKRMEQLAPAQHAGLGPSLARKKYAVLKGFDLTKRLNCFQGLVHDRVRAAWDGMPLDPYLVKVDPAWDFRRRLIRSFTYDFAKDQLTYSDSREFIQKRDYKGRAGDEVRVFDLIPETLLATDGWLSQLIRFDLLNMCDNRRLAEAVIRGYVHFMRIEAKNGKPGQPSPEGIHSDGHDLLAIHLIDRRNINGGVNYIYSKQAGREDFVNSKYETLIHQEGMHHFMDTLYLSDKEVKHYTSHVLQQSKAELGHRDVMIVDFEFSP